MAMIRTHAGYEFDSILSALRAVRDADKSFTRFVSTSEEELSDLRANLDAIIASASGAVAAAGLPRDEVLARAAGMARAA